MLGNWSFGDYFKREAIQYAWELLTRVYGLQAEKLWATVYHTDDEAYDVWANDIGVAPERIVRIGDNKGAPYASDNFWQMAETGPCGPCSEIFYDHGPEVSGGPPGSGTEATLHEI
jgi:alanyl-tRNA synthetase